MEAETSALLEYPYSWHPKSARSLDDFLNQHKPSMVLNDGKTPWIWIHSGREAAYVPPGKTEEAIARASNALKEATEWLESIENEVPTSVHATASVATKNKFVKEARDITTEHLKRISVETGYVNGKWMVFPYHNEVDDVWKRLAKSIHSGPLSSTAIYCAKVSTTPAVLPRGWQHVICLYMSDVYDMAAAREALTVLIRDHGQDPSGVKSDLYTLIGLDSKHPSRIPPNVWRPDDLISRAQAKALKAQFDNADADVKTQPTISGGQREGLGIHSVTTEGGDVEMLDATSEEAQEFSPRVDCS